MKPESQDSLQAFSSSIAGLLSSRAVLEGKIGLISRNGYVLLFFKLEVVAVADAIQELVSETPMLPLQLHYFSQFSKTAWVG